MLPLQILSVLNHLKKIVYLAYYYLIILYLYGCAAQVHQYDDLMVDSAMVRHICGLHIPRATCAADTARQRALHVRHAMWSRNSSA